MRTVVIGLALLAGAIPLEPKPDDEVRLPLLPAPPAAAWRAAGPVMSDIEVWSQLVGLLPRSGGAGGASPAVLSRPDAPPASPAGVDARTRVERTMIEMLDDRYVTLPHDYLPVLLDWYESLVAGLGLNLAESDARGVEASKIAGLMRVFLQARMHRDKLASGGGTPAIGWCRVYLREAWGPHAAGQMHEFLLVHTDRGWFVVDPYSRYLRPLTAGGRYWTFELIVI